MTTESTAHLCDSLTPEEMASTIASARGGRRELQALLDSFTLPIYLTDADGWVTYYNRACVDFAGRRPEPGKDRWCVTWRLYDQSGAFLPHEECPMAVAIQERKPVRGMTAVAERPDGTRVMFTPYPTPTFDRNGKLTGAVNILVDRTDGRQANALIAQAQRCRRLAQSVTDRQTIETLNSMAVDYDQQARALTSN